MSGRPMATSRSVTGIPTGRLGVWWILVSEIVIFGGILVSYLMHRLGHPEWADEALHTNVYAGAFNTFVLLTSSLSAVLAHQAAEQKNGPKAAKLLMLTVLGGAVFLAVKSFEWHHEIVHGYTIFKSGFWSFYYILTGLHALHVIGGMTAIAVVAWKTPSQKSPEWVENVGLYWHLVDVIWIFLFPLLYLAS